MRVLPLALAVLALPAVAQPVAAPPAADSSAAASSGTESPASLSGWFGEVGTSPGYGGSGLGFVNETRAVAVYRTPSGVTLGLAASGRHFGNSTSFTVGPEVAYTRRLGSSVLGANTTLALRADGQAQFVSSEALAGAGYQPSRVSAFAEGVVTRRIGLGRGLALATTGGLYGVVGRELRLDTAPGVTERQLQGGGLAEAGAVVGFQFEADVLGGRLSIGPHGYVPLTETPDARGRVLTAGRSFGFVRFRYGF